MVSLEGKRALAEGNLAKNEMKTAERFPRGICLPAKNWVIY
jgi:hypothetical protein